MAVVNNKLNNSDVNSLITFFQNLSGFQRSNRFRVDITPPKKSNLDQTVLFATTVQIPQQVVTYYPDTVAPSGPNIDIPLQRNFDERFIIDFIVDKNWKARQFFDNWINFIFTGSSTNADKNSKSVGYFTDITGTVDIYALDGTDSVNQRITLYDAYPHTIVPTQMMNDAPNDYLTLTVDMKYRYYTTSSN